MTHHTFWRSYTVRHCTRFSHLSEGEESYLFFIIKDYITTSMHLTAILRKPVKPGSHYMIFGSFFGGKISTVCNKNPRSRPNRCLLQSLKHMKYKQVSNVIRTSLELSQTLRHFQTCLILSPRDLVMWATQWQVGSNPAKHSADGINSLIMYLYEQKQKATN